MAHVNNVPGITKLIGIDYKKVAPILAKNPNLHRIIPWDDASNARRQARQPIYIPDGIDRNINPEDINYSLVAQNTSWGVLAGNNFTLINYQVLQPGTTDKWMSIPPSDDIVLWGNNGTFIFVQYNMSHGQITNAYVIGDSTSILDTAIVVVSEAVAAFATAGYSAVLIGAAQNAAAVDSGQEKLGTGIVNVGVSVGEAYSGTGVGGTIGGASSGAVLDTTSTNLYAGANVADYGDVFDSFSFSDAEATTAITDAENVDYGLSVPDFGGVGNDPTVLADPGVDAPSASAMDYGATPEPSTGFGTNPPDAQFTSDNSSVGSDLSKGVPVAVKLAEGAMPKNSQPANQTTKTGAGTSVQNVTSPVTGPQSQGTFARGSAPALASAVGVMGQIESMLDVNSTGQLKPNTGAAVTGTTNNTNFYLICGLALIAAAVLIKGKV